MEELKKKMTKMQVGVATISMSQPILRSDFCAGDHPSGQCSTTEFIQEEQENFIVAQEKKKISTSTRI